MNLSAKQLSEIDDIQELLEQSANTICMLVNEATSRDKYDILHYLNSAQQVLDLLYERANALDDDYDCE